MGAPPQDEEEATDAQLAALYQRVYAQKLAPYVDFAAWLPFGRRVQKNQKFRALLANRGWLICDERAPRTAEPPAMDSLLEGVQEQHAFRWTLQP